MRVESRIFDLLTVFFFALAVIYGITSGGEAVGTTSLTLTGGLTLIVGTYFGFVSRRVRMRPEDNADAEISDGAGDLGFFSPGSYWPLAVAGAAALAGLAIAFFEIWLIVGALALILITVGGLVFEYHVGANEQ